MKFLTDNQVRRIAEEFGTPVYVYSASVLEQRTEDLLAFPAPFGLCVRFAMKALPTRQVIQFLSGLSLHIDASSGFEAERAMAAGIPASHIQLTGQQLPDNLFELVQKGMLFNACSLHQLQCYGRLPRRPREVSIRVNPGLGSGHSGKTNTGGPSASFGIWHQQLDEAKALAEGYGLTITKLHTHIGSGSDPAVWLKVADISLDIAVQLPDVGILNLGGGLKYGRMSDEESADLGVCGQAIHDALVTFANHTGRRLSLEIEPGTFVVAPAGAIIARVIDVVTTKPHPDGLDFIKVDSGMTENLRPSLYGARHPIEVIPRSSESIRTTKHYAVVGHCCESGDILTPAPGDPETVAARQLTRAEIGDFVVIEDTGAYCSGMPGAGYNSFPAAPEVMLMQDGTFQLIRRRQTLDQLVENEL